MNFQDFRSKYEKVPVKVYLNHVVERPFLSVCVQAYQHAAYIKHCLDGILFQKTDFEFEVLLGEDSSTDDTRKICLEYAKVYPRQIKLFLHHRENNIRISGSPTGRFNFMYNLYSARGKYIALCEGDDYWTDPFKLQKQVDFLEDSRQRILCFHRCMFRGQKNGLETLTEQPRESLTYEYGIRNLLTYWGIPTASIVFRNLISEFPEWFSKVASGDIALCMLLYEKGEFGYLDDVMSVYRITGLGSSVSHTGLRMLHYRSYLYANLNEYFNFKYEKEIYDALFSIMCIYGDQELEGVNQIHQIKYLAERSAKRHVIDSLSKRFNISRLKDIVLSQFSQNYKANDP